MKKYRVESYVKMNDEHRGTEIRECYECESYIMSKSNGFAAIRLDTVNSVNGKKKTEFKRGKYVYTESYPHWAEFEVIVYENETNKIVSRWGNTVEVQETEPTKTEPQETEPAITLNSLAPILKSRRGDIQFAIVYDSANNTDLENGCSIEYAVKNYGEREIKRIEALGNNLLITL